MIPKEGKMANMEEDAYMIKQMRNDLAMRPHTETIWILAVFFRCFLIFQNATQQLANINKLN